MDNDLFEKGLAQRKATLGAEYVEKNLAAADDFTRPFQEAMTAWCWRFGWGDDVIEPKTPRWSKCHVVSFDSRKYVVRACPLASMISAVPTPPQSE